MIPQRLELQSTGDSNPEFSGGMRDEDQHAESELRDDPAEDEHAGNDGIRDDDAGGDDAGDEDAGDYPAGDDNAGDDNAGGDFSGDVPHGDMLPADDSGVAPMDEDDDAENIRTPRVSRTQKRGIVTSPSNKDKSPTKHVKYDRSVCMFCISQTDSDHTLVKMFCGPCQLDQSRHCVPQSGDKRNATACKTCASKKIQCQPPPRWAEKRPAVVRDPSPSAPKPAPRAPKKRPSSCKLFIIFCLYY